MATAMADSDKVLLTIDEAAEWLTARGVSVKRRGIQSWEARGLIEYVKFGGKRRIKLSALEDLIENGTS